MDSKTSEEKQLISTNAGAAVVPIIPPEIIHEILDHLADDPDHGPLQSCALISKSWVLTCQRRLFHTIHFTSRNMTRWLEAFPVPEESPARHVRHLRFLIGGDDDVPKKFSEYTPRFTNAEKVSFLEGEGLMSAWRPPSWRLPQSVTSLTIDVGAVTTLIRVRDIVAQLPELDDLSLSGSIKMVGRRAFPVIGTALMGRFGGKLRLFGRYAAPSVMEMLLEAPTGLHFTEVEIRGLREHLPSTAKLTEACGKTLVKLSYRATFQCRSRRFEREMSTLTPPPDVDAPVSSKRSFDFSKSPHLQEVSLGVRWTGGNLFWIPAALSTLRSATSPRLSAIRLDFAHATNRSVRDVISFAGSDVLQVTDEVSRIEREFEGAVNVTVLQDAVFKGVFDTLDVRFYPC